MVRHDSTSQAATQHTSHSSDEIDLLDLLHTLWKGKLLIILIAAIGFLGAYGLSLLMKEEWRSTASVVAPRLSNASEFIEKNRSVQRVVDNKTDVDVNELMEQVFNTFLYTAADSNEKYNYLRQTHLFQQLMEDENANAGLILDSLSQRLTVKLPDEKSQTLASEYMLSFTSDSAESPQNILSGYISNINRIATETSQQEFTNNLEALIKARKQEIADIERDLSNQRKVAINQYSEALLTAQKAGIKSNSANLLARTDARNNLIVADPKNNVVLEINSNSDQLYLQGEEVLQALLEVTQNAPIIYPESYYRLQYEVEALETLLGEQAAFESFSYLMQPTLPSTRLSPKRAQIAVIGGLIGGVIACLIVLIVAAFRNRQTTLS